MDCKQCKNYEKKDIAKIGECQNCKNFEPAPESAFQKAARTFLSEWLGLGKYLTIPWVDIQTGWPLHVKPLRTFRKAVLDEVKDLLAENGDGFDHIIESLKDKD